MEQETYSRRDKQGGKNQRKTPTTNTQEGIRAETHQGEMAESNLSDERQEAKQNMNEMKDCQNKSRNKTQTMVPRQLNTGKR